MTRAQKIQLLKGLKAGRISIQDATTPVSPIWMHKEGFYTHKGLKTPLNESEFKTHQTKRDLSIVIVIPENGR